MSRFRIGLLALGVLAAAGWGLAEPTDAGKKAGPGFTVGQETTRVTGPRTPSGLIDYAAALNERLGRGVKPEDNAAVFLWRAFGPHTEGATMPPEFYKWLGIPSPPEKGDYYVNLIPFLQKHPQLAPKKSDEEILDEWVALTGRPWIAKEFPHVTAWLKANEKALALVVQGTHRPHYFSPLAAAEPGAEPGRLIGALLPGLQKCREFANALCIRAMLKVGEGRPEEAWQDLLACHRLGRLVARGPTMIEELVGIAIDALASQADVAFLDRAWLDAEQLKACRRDLRGLPPMTPAADHVDLCERFVFLDSVMALHHVGPIYLASLTSDFPIPSEEKGKALLAGLDWDAALRTGNHWYDRLVAGMRLPDHAARKKELEALEAELRELKDGLVAAGGLNRTFPADKSSAGVRGRLIGEVLATVLVAAVRRVQEAYERSEQYQRNLQVAFALVAYRRDHGHYPKGLEALLPAFLERVPGDLFTGKALLYRPTDNSYLLYSVGANGRDDQGRSYGDNPPGDDLVVRLPLPRVRHP